MAVAAAQDNADDARSEVRRLGAVEQAREQAEARVADLLASTSWKITAPLRGVSSLFGAGPTRRRRLGLVAGMGQGPSGAKGLARIAVYGLGRAVARLPGGRAVAQIIAFALPGPYRWLSTRYFAYRNVAAPLTEITDGPVAPPEVPPACSQAATPQILPGFSAEEQAMLLRLRPNSRDRAA